MPVYIAKKMITGDGTRVAFPSGQGTNGQVLTSNGSGGTTWTTVSGGAPGGSTTQMQINNAGAFGGAANVTYSGGVLTVAGGAKIHRGNSDGVCIGDSAGCTDSNAVCIGFFAGSAVTVLDQDSSVRVGRHAGYAAVGGNDVCLGHAAGQYAYSCASAVAIGPYAARNPAQTASFFSFQSVVIGIEAAMQANSHQTATIVGAFAGRSATAAVGSVLLGYQAGYASTDCTNAVMLGSGAGKNTTAGRYCVFIGSEAGRDLSRNYSLVIEGIPASGIAGNTGLIYGEFDNRLVRINGALQAYQQTSGVGVVIKIAATTPGNALEIHPSASSTPLASVSSTGLFRAPAGDASAPGLSFHGDTNTGLFSQAADAIGVSIGGTERARWVATGLDMGVNYLLAGSAVGTNDWRLRRTGTKTVTIDDGAAGAATVTMVGTISATALAGTTVGGGGGTDGGTGASVFGATGLYTPGFCWASGGFRLAATTTWAAGSSGGWRADTGVGVQFGTSGGYIHTSVGGVGIKVMTDNASTLGQVHCRYTTLITAAAPAVVTDGFQMYSTDVQTGNAGPTFKLENGDVLTLFKGAALTAADAGAINSGDAGTDAVIANIRTRLGEAEARLQALGLLA